MQVENSAGASEIPAPGHADWQAPKTRHVGLLVQVTGHLLASLLGVAIGYYILCCVRPAEYNWWGLPIPGGSSAASGADP
jgi:hypothetical protein